MPKYDHVREVLGVVADRLEREKYDLQQEIKKLREENRKLKQRLTAMKPHANLYRLL